MVEKLQQKKQQNQELKIIIFFGGKIQRKMAGK